jgi:hypothetical protein
MTSPTPADSADLDGAARVVSRAFESYGQAWWTDDSGDVLARVAVEVLEGTGRLRSARQTDSSKVLVDREDLEFVLSEHTRIFGRVGDLRSCAWCRLAAALGEPNG